MTDKLRLAPDQASYVAMPGNEVLRVQLDGGAGRYRRDIIGGWATITAQWTLDRMQFNYLSAFHRTKTSKGALPFNCDLILDAAVPSEYLCYFIPETFQLISQAGLSYVVAANLEVKPQAPDPDADNALVMLYEEYADDGGILDLLALLVNVDLDAI